MPKPPCSFCSAKCCKQQDGRQFAVLLEENETYPAEINLLEETVLGEEAIRVLPYINGQCVYLQNDRCSIYPNRPQRCREFNCAAGLNLKGEGNHSFFLEDNPDVVDLITLHCKF